MAETWSDEEIDIIVADYFAMLAADLSNQPFNKAEHNRTLHQLIPRNRSSIEFKHQNISAVMLGLGQPWITGYMPAKNFQYALIDGVLRWLDAHPNWLVPKTFPGAQSAVRDARPLWIGPPPAQRNEPPLVDPVFMAAIGQKYDVAERDARNRALGKAVEDLILQHERLTLAQAGRDDLVMKVRWTSVQDGDGFGFDIASFEPDGRERLIEVKTTNGWERTPFHITRNELQVASARRDDWHLVRLWGFCARTEGFRLASPAGEAHRFDPDQLPRVLELAARRPG
jgi:hypothetical protein